MGPLSISWTISLHTKRSTPLAVWRRSPLCYLQPLMQSARADIIVLPGTYGETIELIESHARHLRLIKLNCPLKEPFAKTNSPRILRSIPALLLERSTLFYAATA